MPAVLGEKKTKVKLIHQVQGEKGEMTQSTRTFSNLVDDVTDDALLGGVQAMSEVFVEAPAQIIRVDEAEVTESV